jgi:hypothetical protein
LREEEKLKEYYGAPTTSKYITICSGKQNDTH